VIVSHSSNNPHRRCRLSCVSLNDVYVYDQFVTEETVDEKRYECKRGALGNCPYGVDCKQVDNDRGHAWRYYHKTTLPPLSSVTPATTTTTPTTAPVAAAPSSVRAKDNQPTNNARTSTAATARPTTTTAPSKVSLSSSVAICALDGKCYEQFSMDSKRCCKKSHPSCEIVDVSHTKAAFDNPIKEPKLSPDMPVTVPDGTAGVLKGMQVSDSDKCASTGKLVVGFPSTNASKWKLQTFDETELKFTSTKLNAPWHHAYVLVTISYHI
jgi:hypothetical protein